MNKFSKKASLIVAACMALTMFMTACGDAQQAQPSSKSDDTAPSNEKLSFSVTTVNFGESPLETEIHKEWMKKTSEKMGKEIDIKWELINQGDYKEKLQVIIAGGSLPDVLTYFDDPKAKANVDKYGDMGVYADISANFDKAPNYKALLDKDPNAKSTVFTPAGKIYGFYNLSYVPTGSAHGSDYTMTMVKNRVLKENNLQIPTNLNEMYEVAKALKDKGVSKYPIIQNEEWQNPEGVIFKAYHTNANRFWNGTKYEYGPLSDDYKEALKYLNKIYTEGLISPDYFTHTVDNGNAALADGSACIVPSAWEGYAAVWKAQYPDDEWVAIPQLSSDKYPDAWQFEREFKSEYNFNSGYSMIVSEKSKVKDDIIKFLDLQYDPDIIDILNWGIKDKTYKVDASGKKEFLYNGEAKKAEIAKMGMPISGSCRSGIFPQPQDMDLWRIESQDSQPIFYNGKIQDVKIVAFSTEVMNDKNTSPNDKQPMITTSSDENEKYANIMTPVETFAKEQKVKFIKGQRSFDEWDKYIAELNKMGDIQAAMDIYNSKI